MNTWQEFVHPDFDPQIDIRAEHPIIWSTNAVDHIRAVFEKANQAISQHRYLNLPQGSDLWVAVCGLFVQRVYFSLCKPITNLVDLKNGS